MPALSVPALVAAGLLTLAGAQKVLDPTMTVGALRAMRLPVSTLLVRIGAGAELALGVAAVGIGGVALWSVVALSYLAFSAFVVVALRRGAMIGSCGCFGREDTLPHITHVIVNLALATVAASTSVTVDGALVDAVVEHRGEGVVVAGLSAVGIYLLYAVYVSLPSSLTTR